MLNFKIHASRQRKLKKENVNALIFFFLEFVNINLNFQEIGLLSDTMFDEADKDGDGFMSEENLGVLVNQFPDALDALTKKWDGLRIGDRNRGLLF